jgi:hypothetical protein
MAEEKKSGEKSIEMRLAEIEDKLAKLHITEEEMRAYQKVSSLLGGASGMEAGIDPTTAALSPTVCQISPRLRLVPRIVPRIVNECICGPCACFTSGGGGMGGFGGFGM